MERDVRKMIEAILGILLGWGIATFNFMFYRWMDAKFKEREAKRQL